jgi:hypothetical protein
MYFLPTLIVQQTLPGRIHQPGSVCLPHLGEPSLTSAFYYILINLMLFVRGTFRLYLYPLSVTKSQSGTKMWLNLEHRNKKPSDIPLGKWNVLGEKLETGKRPKSVLGMRYGKSRVVRPKCAFPWTGIILRIQR